MQPPRVQPSALPSCHCCPRRVVLSVNDKWHYCQNSDILVGSRAMRDRHLRLLGYCLVQVSPARLPPRLLGQSPLCLVARGRAKRGGWWELVSLPGSCPRAPCSFLSLPRALTGLCWQDEPWHPGGGTHPVSV